jgi:hypothetical protein
MSRRRQLVSLTTPLRSRAIIAIIVAINQHTIMLNSIVGTYCKRAIDSFDNGFQRLLIYTGFVVLLLAIGAHYYVMFHHLYNNNNNNDYYY